MLKRCAVARMPALCASSMAAAYCSGVTFWTLPSRSSTQILTIWTPRETFSRTALRASSSFSIWIRRPHRLLAGDAAAGAEEARRARDHLVAHRKQFEIVGAEAHGGADAPIAALLADRGSACRARR